MIDAMTTSRTLMVTAQLELVPILTALTAQWTGVMEMKENMLDIAL